MPNCCGKVCACKLRSESPFVTITGTGTSQDPFVLDSDGVVAVDTSDIDMNVDYLAGVGYRVSGHFGANSKLSALGDVVDTTPGNGQVLTWNGTSWVPAAPVTAATGSVQHDSSLQGSGSVADQLAVRPVSAGNLAVTSDGLDLSSLGQARQVRRYATDAARDTALAGTAALQLGSLSTVDTRVGRPDAWTGSQWISASPFDYVIVDAAVSELSGAYVENDPVSVLCKQVNTTTDENGLFTIFDDDDLADLGGVITAFMQPTGDSGCMVMANVADDGTVTGTGYYADGTGVMSSVPMTGWATALVY